MLKKCKFFLGFVFMCCCVFAKTGSTVIEIKNRGYLKCGVSTGLPGFSYIDGDGNWQGFDVDFCRAIAASILGDGKKVDSLLQELSVNIFRDNGGINNRMILRRC